jgi:hypothetical protein
MCQLSKGPQEIYKNSFHQYQYDKIRCGRVVSERGNIANIIETKKKTPL